MILTHGWPWTFWDLRHVIGPLTDPAAYGGDPADSFDVVIPSLPGYGFSMPLTRTGVNFWSTADLWVKLMRDHLGYDRFAAEGGDWGALVTQQLGHKYSEHLIGSYLTLAIPLDFMEAGIGYGDYEPHEQAAVDRVQEVSHAVTSHIAVNVSDPQSFSYAMDDSPAGMAAWLIERRRAWSDCGGVVEKRFSKDELITNTMLYWVTGSFVTAARFYAELARNPWRPSHDRRPVVEAPTAIGVFPKEILIPPRRWAEEYHNLKRWTPMTAGGHFAPAEEPQQLVADVREFFRGRT